MYNQTDLNYVQLNISYQPKKPQNHEILRLFNLYTLIKKYNIIFSSILKTDHIVVLRQYLFLKQSTLNSVVNFVRRKPFST